MSKTSKATQLPSDSSMLSNNEDDIDSELLESSYPVSSSSNNNSKTSGADNSGPGSGNATSFGNERFTGENNESSDASTSNDQTSNSTLPRHLPKNWTKPTTTGAGLGLWRAIAGELNKLSVLQKETADTYHNAINENQLSGVLAVYDLDTAPARLVSEYLRVLEKKMNNNNSASNGKKDTKQSHDLTSLSQHDVEELQKAYADNKARLGKEKKALETVIESLRKLVPESLVNSLLQHQQGSSNAGGGRNGDDANVSKNNNNNSKKADNQEDEELLDLFSNSAASATSGTRKRKLDYDSGGDQKLFGFNSKRSRYGPDNTNNGAKGLGPSSGVPLSKSASGSSTDDPGLDGLSSSAHYSEKNKHSSSSNAKQSAGSGLSSSSSSANSSGSDAFSTKNSSSSFSSSSSALAGNGPSSLQSSHSSSSSSSSSNSSASSSSSLHYSFSATDADAYMSTLFNGFPSNPLPIGTQVAFHLPRPQNSQSHHYHTNSNSSSSSDGEEEWIQCEITKVLGNGTRYEVRDPEPDENGNPGKTYKALQKDLIPMVSEITISKALATGTVAALGLGSGSGSGSGSAALGLQKVISKLPQYPVGALVLAQYPETTTFYRAEVMGTKRDGKCRLKFEGEEEENKEQEVERRVVLPIK